MAKAEKLVQKNNNDIKTGLPSPRGGKEGGALKIAIVVSHPIQHFCPQYVSFAANEKVQLKVFFGSALGYKKYTDKNFKQEISWGNLNLHKFDHVFLNGEAVLPSDKNLDAPSLEKELLDFAPQLLIVYGYFQALQRRAYRWAVKNKVPLAYISDSELRHRSNLLKDRIKSIYLRHYFSKIAYFLTVGNANEAFYTRHGVSNSKMIRMHFPIDVEQYRKSYHEKKSLRSAIRRQYDIAENETVLSVVGKLSPWKNQDHLIKAIHLLEEQGIYVKAFILGSGLQEEAWKKKAAALQHSKIYFPGFVSIETLPAYYASTDIYVHPASLEPHSIAVSEAIYMGCPVIISSRCGSYGVDDDVQEGKNGTVFTFADIKQLAQKIKGLMADKESLHQWGDYAHETAVAFQHHAHHIILETLISRLNAAGNKLQ
jgi:glycosyltransferase involved in cell wall biosynthesis